MKHHAIPVLLALGLSTAVSAQTLLIPAAANGADLPSSSGWPFDLAQRMRILYVYDSSHFTSAGVTTPVTITRIRVRANGVSATWVGDTIASLSLDLSTAPSDFNSISTTFDQNHGNDRARVYSAPLVIPGGSSVAGAPGPFHVDVPITPFLYDPSAGDLTVDWDCSGPSSATNTPSIDTSSTTGQALARRVYGLNYTGAATGTLWSGESAHAIEFTYGSGAGYASASTYGTGCYDRASSFYETFTGATFDLGGAPTNSIRCVPNGQGGYAVLPGTNLFFTPASADLLLGDDALSPSLPLGFAFPYAGTATTAVKLCTNGFVWLRDTETSTDLSPTPAELLSLGPRIAAYWTDLNPATLVSGARVGSVHFDIDPASGDAVFTWLNVPEYANSGNRNTLQLQLSASGIFEMRWQGTTLSATRALLVGMSRGLGARDPGNRDLSASVPFETFADGQALQLQASARPVMGSTIQLQTTSIPAGGILGATLLGAQRFDPGIDLAALGMPGCRQYISPDVTLMFVVAGSSNATPIALPSRPSLVGLRARCQSAVFVPGVNPLGALTSNGVELVLDVN